MTTKTILDGKHAGKKVRIIQRKVLMGVNFLQVSSRDVPLITIKETRLK